MECRLCVLVLTSLVGCVLTATPHVIPPTVSSGTEAAIIIVPGASITGGAYKPLGLELQKSSSLRLWVVILGEFLANIPAPLQLGGAFSNAISLLRKQGMKSDNIFLAGHSLGGVMVGQYGKQNANKLKGILLLASYLTKGGSMASYPLPVLTIVGDLDGLTRITRIVDTFQELNRNVSKSSAAMYRTPVVIMPGVNHGQFASGKMPPNVVRYDLDPEVDLATAHTMIAKHCSDFMVSVLQDPSKVNAARLALKQEYSNTNDIMKPLLKMKTLDLNDQNVSGWTIQAQKMLLAPVNGKVEVTNTEKDELTFITSKPKIDVMGSMRKAETFTHVDLPLNPLDVSTSMASPRQLEAKMKSLEAILKSSSFGVKSGVNQISTCKEINKAAFELALSSSSPKVKSRYTSKAVRPIIFKDDVKMSTGLTWVNWKLELKESAHALEVTSASLSTPTNSPFFAGMFYCKLLPPYRAMEWIYVDSLRK